MGGYHHGYHHGYGCYGDMTEKEKSDFLLGLIHHAVKGVLHVAHHAINFVGGVLGDEDMEDRRPRPRGPYTVSRYVNGVWTTTHHYNGDEEEPKEDFLLGLVHHYVKGCVGVLHHAVNFVGHVVGDEDVAKQDMMRPSDNEEESKDDFLLGLAHHYVKGCVNVLHHAVNFVGGVLGDEDVAEKQD